MAIYHPTSVTCSCGRTFPCHVAHTLNVRRNADIRRQIVDLELHRVVCPQCKRSQTVERPLSFVDPDRNTLFFVKPRGSRVDFRRDSKRLAHATEGLPKTLITKKKGHQLRVVYGFDELREKLTAQDLKLDDRIVELFKVLIVYEHPFLLNRARLQLFLTGEVDRKLRFVAYHHNQKEGYEIFIPKALVDDLRDRTDELRRWVKGAHKHEPLFDLPDAWVNVRRWTIRYEPLETLRTFALAIREGKQVDLRTEPFATMLKRLPRGPQLPGSAKQDLRTVFDYAQSRVGMDDVQDKLLEVRFDVTLDDEWARNDRPNDIDTIWQLLSAMPVTNVEGNTQLREIDLIAGNDSFYGNGVIEIGENVLGRREGFEDVLRHEVGHAVHAERDADVTPWLATRFGWRVFDGNENGIDEWVKAMGGWDTVPKASRPEIIRALITCAGSGSTWGPGTPPRIPPGHPWWSNGFGPRLAYERSRENWYETYDQWYRHDGRAFFVNYWYANFMCVSAEALDNFVARMPDRYAAMSPNEFFAEIYALFYDQDDPQRRVIADDRKTADWLETNIGRWDPANPRMPGKRRPKRAGR